MNILLCGELEPDELSNWLQALAAALPTHRLLAARGEVPDASIAAAFVANPPPGSLQGLPGLRLVQSLWAGVDRLLADTSLPAGVPIARMVDPAMCAAMAETALWATLSLHRRFFDYARQQAAAHWWPLPQRRADETCVLLLGQGQMGRAVAQRLRMMDYRVLAWRRTAPDVGDRAPEMAGVQTVHGPRGLEQALPQARVLINLLPLTPDTRGLLAAPLFAQLPAGAAVVNLARGAHLVDADLLAALASGRLSHAVLDVFHREPLPAGHAFWSHPQITVLPHAAAATDLRSAAAVAAANIDALHQGRPLTDLVRREVGY